MNTYQRSLSLLFAITSLFFCLEPSEISAFTNSFEDLPLISKVSPSTGTTKGGKTVTIKGNNFIGATAVKFGMRPATHFTINSSSMITAISPAGIEETVDISVTTLAGTSLHTFADRFTYEGLPLVSQISPDTGSSKGGKTVTIKGDNFTATTSVHFGTERALSFKVVSPTKIKAVSPSGAGSVNITVTTPVGTSYTFSSTQYTYKNK